MKKHKLNYILDDINRYANYKFSNNVNDRLTKTLNMYVEELNNSYSRLRGKDAYFVAKRLSK